MGKFIAVMVATVFVVLVAGGAVLAFWDIPVPSSPVEKVIPNARFPK